MKQIFFLILFVISFSVVAISQTITFDKTLPASTATQVLQTDDGGYLLNCVGNLNFIKTDQNGYIEWTKEYPEITNPGKQICKTFDGGYIAVGNKLNGSYTDICLIKLDQNLDTIWTKTYGAYDQPETGHAVIQLPDSSFIISSLDYPGFYLRKTDVYGSLLWAKMIGGTSFWPSNLVNLNDGNFLFGKLSLIIKMNSDADTIWSNVFVNSISAYLTNDGFILNSSRDSLRKLDQDGNILWQKDISYVKSFAQSTNDKYILLKGKSYLPSTFSILTIDTSGNILSEISFEERGEYITNTEDGGFAICGNISNYAWLLKTDGNINYTAVNLRTPLDGSTLNIFETYPITWRANNVNYVNIEYSVDNQISWNKIISYYPADADTFLWTLPELPAGDIYLKISDSFNSGIYDRSDPPQKTIIYQSTDYIAANEIKMRLNNNAIPTPLPYNFWVPVYWPGGENATITSVLSDGLVWGGIINGETRVNGTTYECGIIPGFINENGIPSDPFDIQSKIYKLKKDWQLLPTGRERDRYQFDYLNWPVDIGAPWNDNNGDGIYTPGIDEPKILGEQTIFFVTNDLDTSRSLTTYGSNPIGLEFQMTTFGYNSELLKDVVFKKYRIINKSSSEINDMYLSYWTDDDLGFSGDDYVGCDTLLNLGFTYNGDNYDDIPFGYGTPPPAVGHLFVQPPITVATPTDSARFGDGWRKGYKNLKINSFVIYLKGDYGSYKEPWTTMLDTVIYEGTLEFYNNMQGLTWYGSPFVDPNTGEETKFCLSGDPVTKVGWYEGDGWPSGPIPYERRFSITTGNFNLAPNDTQEVVVAVLIRRGTDNINSVAELKNYAAQIQYWYDNDFVTDVEETNSTIPLEYSLSQNYPNPFNPSTVISYQLPVSGLVSLKVYDILGSEVATLVNEEKSAGNYQVEFKSTVGSLQLASGIYFYRLQAGSFTQTKKMMLIK